MIIWADSVTRAPCAFLVGNVDLALPGNGALDIRGKMSCVVERTHSKIATNFGVNAFHAPSGKKPNIDFAHKCPHMSSIASLFWTAVTMNWRKVPKS